MSKDLYAVLGVDRAADEQTIKRAYRKLAGKLHPDKNPGKANEQRFKEVTAAYEVLGDAKKRGLYDEFGESSLQQGFDPERARWARQHGYDIRGGGGGPGVQVDFGDLFGGAARGGGIGDVFGDLFTRAGARGGGRRGQDLESQVTVDFAEAVRGTTLTLSVHGDPVQVRIPAGAADGSRVRVKGKGTPGTGRAAAGDLVLVVRVRPHRHFRRDGDDLYLDLPITIGEAFSGGTVRVPTPHGEVKLTVPQGAQSGQLLRLRGKGVARKGYDPGDMYVRFLVRYPAGDDPAVVSAIETLASHGADPRGDIAF